MPSCGPHPGADHADRRRPSRHHDPPRGDGRRCPDRKPCSDPPRLRRRRCVARLHATAAGDEGDRVLAERGRRRARAAGRRRCAGTGRDGAAHPRATGQPAASRRLGEDAGPSSRDSAGSAAASCRTSRSSSVAATATRPIAIAHSIDVARQDSADLRPHCSRRPGGLGNRRVRCGAPCSVVDRARFVPACGPSRRHDSVIAIERRIPLDAPSSSKQTRSSSP